MVLSFKNAATLSGVRVLRLPKGVEDPAFPGRDIQTPVAFVLPLQGRGKSWAHRPRVAPKLRCNPGLMNSSPPGKKRKMSKTEASVRRPIFIDANVTGIFRPGGGRMYTAPDIQPVLGLGIIHCHGIYKHCASGGAKSTRSCFPFRSVMPF